MYKLLFTLVILLFSYKGHSQVLPSEGSKLHYRLIGFSFPGLAGNSYTLQIAAGNFNSADSFRANIKFSVKTKKTRVVAEVPGFGQQYTWRIVTKSTSADNTGFHHFSTDMAPFVDTNIARLRILKSSEKYKDAYVFLDGVKTLYDMKGKPVWYLPDIKGLGTPPRDLKISPQKTITFLLDSRGYEINYNGDILWSTPSRDASKKEQGGGYHHEFTRLVSGNYMVLGKKTSLWELPATIESKVLNAPGEIIVHDSINHKYYQKIEFGTVLEYSHAGNLVWSWDPSEYLKGSDLYSRRTIEGLFDIDVHENSFSFDEVSKTFLLSLRDVSRVLKVKYPEGIVTAAYGGIYKQGFREIENPLFCYQHSCKQSREGYVYLYDNNGCHLKELPKLIMMTAPEDNKNPVKKVWEYECNVEGMNEKNPVDSVFTSGGNVIELPDGSMFASMSVLYGNLFIVSRDKRILWNAISERWNPTEKKWKVNANYRASIIVSRKELEDLIWNDGVKDQ
jgi:hypothetical protein